MKSMTRWTSKRSIGVVLILAAMLIVTICGLTDNLLFAQADMSNPKQTFGVLNHAPLATADLLWSQTNQTLVVTVTATGLAPGSTHPDAIHNGSKGGCSSSTQGDVIDGLNPVTADSTGKGSSITTIPNVPGGVPARGWYIDIHNGPQLADSGQQERIACADITNPNALISSPPPTSPSSSSGNSNKTITNESPGPHTNGTITDGNPPPPPKNGPTPLTNVQLVHVILGGSADSNQSITVGGVELSITHGGRKQSDSLKVKIFLFRLAPNSTHIAHIHSGSCEAQGPVLYPLNPIHADGIGFASSTTVVPNVSSIPGTGWYVNVHRAATMDELTGSQGGFDPIACANVSTSSSTPNTTPPTPPSPTPFIE